MWNSDRKPEARARRPRDLLVPELSAGLAPALAEFHETFILPKYSADILRFDM
jgi:hypothetical protein